MQVIVRADASIELGSGHVMRCLTLSRLLRDKLNASVTFICAELPGNLCESIESNHFTVVRLPDPKLNLRSKLSEIDNELSVFSCNDSILTSQAIQKMAVKPDLLVVDHYFLDASWEKHVRESVNKIMAIDDLANRSHECDFLLDQNHYPNMESRYSELVPSHCHQFLGPEYLLIREEFFELIARKRSNSIQEIKRVLMFFGGSDPTHETIKSIKAIDMLNSDRFIFDVIVGKLNADQIEVKKMSAVRKQVNYHHQINNMAELIFSADLAVIAAGGTIWEAFILGLPVITILTAKNQYEAISGLSNDGLIINLGWHCDVSARDISEAINSAVFDFEETNKMAKRASYLLKEFDGQKSLVDKLNETCRIK